MASKSTAVLKFYRWWSFMGKLITTVISFVDLSAVGGFKLFVYFSLYLF